MYLTAQIPAYTTPAFSDVSAIASEASCLYLVANNLTRFQLDLDYTDAMQFHSLDTWAGELTFLKMSYGRTWPRFPYEQT
jgi:hypothetical protein